MKAAETTISLLIICISFSNFNTLRGQSQDSSLVPYLILYLDFLEENIGKDTCINAKIIIDGKKHLLKKKKCSNKTNYFLTIKNNSINQQIRLKGIEIDDIEKDKSDFKMGLNSIDDLITFLNKLTKIIRNIDQVPKIDSLKQVLINWQKQQLEKGEKQFKNKNYAKTIDILKAIAFPHESIKNSLHQYIGMSYYQMEDCSGIKAMRDAFPKIDFPKTTFYLRCIHDIKPAEWFNNDTIRKSWYDDSLTINQHQIVKKALNKNYKGKAENLQLELLFNDTFIDISNTIVNTLPEKDLSFLKNLTNLRRISSQGNNKGLQYLGGIEYLPNLNTILLQGSTIMNIYSYETDQLPITNQKVIVEMDKSNIKEKLLTNKVMWEGKNIIIK